MIFRSFPLRAALGAIAFVSVVACSSDPEPPAAGPRADAREDSSECGPSLCAACPTGERAAHTCTGGQWQCACVPDEDARVFPDACGVETSCGEAAVDAPPDDADAIVAKDACDVSLDAPEGGDASATDGGCR
jgi:hypothetical protein